MLYKALFAPSAVCVRTVECPVRPHLILPGRFRRSSSPRYAGAIAESGHFQAMSVGPNPLDGDSELMCCQSNDTMSGYHSAGSTEPRSFDRNSVIGL